MSYRNDSIAFVIGEDLAHHGLHLPQDACAAMARGHEHERSTGSRARPADRFVRKWLQLRIGAWRRNRVFSSDVTPEFLADIDVAHCPVTGELLTHGTGEDSDWSVDRIDNDGGYAQLNLVVLSTRANAIKGSMSALAITEQARRNERRHGLLADHWKRLAYLVGRYLPHVATQPVEGPEQATAHLPLAAAEVYLEEMLDMSLRSARLRNRILALRRAVFDVPTRVEFDRFVERLRLFSRDTLGPERTASAFAANADNWESFSRFWHTFSGRPEFLLVAQAMAEHYERKARREGFGAPVYEAQWQADVAKATCGYA